MPRNRIAAVAVVAAALALTWSGTAAAAPDPGTYTEELLGTLGSGLSLPRAINNPGWVVGNSLTAAGDVHGFRARPDQIIDLPPLPGELSAEALDVNDGTETVGISRTAIFEHAVIWQSDGQIRLLTTPPNTSTRGFDINNLGEVTGDISSFVPRTSEGALWLADGQLVRLGSFLPTGLNDRGDLVGTIPSDTGTHAALWQSGVVTDLTTRGLGSSSVATGINNAGEIIGMDRDGGAPFRAFVLTDQGVSHIGPAGQPSTAVDVNDRGQVLATIAGQPALWSNGTTTLLADRGLDRSFSFVGLNDRGQIAGEDFSDQAALFTPTGSVPAGPAHRR